MGDKLADYYSNKVARILCFSTFARVIWVRPPTTLPALES